jgi:4-alpha-glucanotransferase
MDDLKDILQKTITGHGWKKIGIGPHHGINFPLSALHSDNSCGIGEFFDLIPIIDWCHRLKIDFIQLLPLNSSEWDSSPYNAISSCALNIVYLSLQELPYLEKLPQLKGKLKELCALCKTNRIAYTEVLTHKLSWLHAYFDEVGEKMINSKELKDFIAENPWVEPYALFKTLHDRLEGAPCKTWPQDLCSPSQQEMKTLIQRYWSNVSFYLVLQYLSFNQLKKVKEYANSKGIFLMGDFPFLVSKESVDIWQYPDFFDAQVSGGAPPDYYNADGQNWGFPIYRWENMRKEHFNWWKQRLKCAENFFDLVRLDHVLGFFRIWAIPPNRPAKEGHYDPVDKKKWEPQGRELLTMIASSTQMLPIAEDLGTVPDVVRPCLKELGICGTKVMRWERKWKEDKSFIPIQCYPPISITCTSTHDMETLALWWKNYGEEAQEYAKFKHWTYSPILTDIQREEILWDSHHTTSLFHVNLLQEYLAFFPELIWPNPEDERINIPGKILPTNWTYRFKSSVETITSHEELFLKMEKILHSPAPSSLVG